MSVSAVPADNKTHHLEDRDWKFTSDDKERGYIQSVALKELWFHTGTTCNLSCPFCLEGSSPGDNRLEQISLPEIKPLILEAVDLGVEQFSFTGGEPFVNKHFLEILSFSLDHKPCLVLTNGTKPLRKSLDAIQLLKNKTHELAFRISLDSPVAETHDISRGKGNFDQAIKSLKDLHEAGFKVSVARHAAPEENAEAVDQQYKDVLAKVGLPSSIKIVSFPDFLRPGQSSKSPEITENCMTTYHNEGSRSKFMCSFSRMIVKINSNIKIYACTLVDDDPDYEMGLSLSESLQYRVMLRHHRCFSCFSGGASCSEV